MENVRTEELIHFIFNIMISSKDRTAVLTAVRLFFKSIVAEKN